MPSLHRRRIGFLALFFFGFCIPLRAQPSIPADELDQFIYLPIAIRVDPYTPPSADADGLTQINFFRAVGNLPLLTENPSWSQGCANHARYMVKTDTIAHSEDLANEWYTESGNQAAVRSNLLVFTQVDLSTQLILAEWMRQPFHGVGMIDPRLASTGYGEYRETLGSFQLGACMDVAAGAGSVPASVTYPVMWPGPDSKSPFLSYNGRESPDPLTACPGYTIPTGPAIFLLLGSGEVTPQVSDSSLLMGEIALDHCIIDQTRYVNPSNPGLQTLGRQVLQQRSAVVMLPKMPLAASTEYTVSLTNSGSLHQWTFRTGAAAIHLLP